MRLACDELRTRTQLYGGAESIKSERLPETLVNIRSALYNIFGDDTPGAAGASC